LIIKSYSMLGRVPMKRYFRANFRPTIAIALLTICGAVASMAEAVAKVPAGTAVRVRIIETLNSETSRVGQKFHGTLASPIMAGEKTVFPKGADVTGEVVGVERSGRLSHPGELHLRLRTVRSGGRSYSLTVRTVSIKGKSHTKSNVTKIGGGAAAGTLIGALAGGGKGAAVGAGVGAAAGTGVAAGTGKQPAEVRSETLLVFVTRAAR
jgi:hypothetical protein